jgi:putative transcriptional regulator
MTKDEIVALRKKSGLSQSKFAQKHGIKCATLQQWEQGRRKPSGTSMQLLEMIKAEYDDKRD